ncbi:MAG: 50S ribosomal protein L4 [Deltaproteobacteria bacterium]|nr:50S ribosomal protein L4 [Deltaproteobacteria bacterium]
MSVALYSQRNEAVGQVELPAVVFGQPVRRHLLYEAVKMQLANRRAGTAATKTRAFVRGGGKKPWRQKGTGRARAGSSRSPIWAGGASVFGPQPRDYSYRMPASARKAALASALALKAREGKLLVLDKIELEAAKTKFVVKLLADLKVVSGLIILPAKDDTIERAARNLPKVKVLRVEGANVYDLLRYEHVIVTPQTVAALAARVG